jgi:hypothetical protein
MVLCMHTPKQRNLVDIKMSTMAENIPPMHQGVYRGLLNTTSPCSCGSAALPRLTWLVVPIKRTLHYHVSRCKRCRIIRPAAAAVPRRLHLLLFMVLQQPQQLLLLWVLHTLRKGTCLLLMPLHSL